MYIGSVELVASLRQAADNYELKQKVADLNRFIVSYKEENQKLKDRIEIMRKGGDVDLQHEIEQLESILKDRYPEARISAQRREIRILHGIIKKLREPSDD